MSTVEIILGVATIVGTLVGLISWLDARNSKKELKKYTYLFDLADKNIDKSLTLEELNRLHEEKQEMDKVIKEEIPKQARIAVLYDRLKADEEYLSTSYYRYIQTKNEYDDMQQKIDVEIPENILTEIEHQILPEYILKQKKQRYMSMLTTISYATAFLAIIPFFNVFSRYFILVTAYPLVNIIRLSMPKDKYERKRYIKRIAYTSVFIISFLLTITSAYIILFTWRYAIYVELILFISAPIFTILLIYGLISRLKNRKKNK